MPDTERIKIMLVDDHKVVRQGLATFITMHKDFEIIGEAGNGLEAIEKVKIAYPDVILLDLVMPEMDGLETIKHIKAMNANVKIVVLTSFGEDSNIVAAIKAGAVGFMFKDVEPEVIIQTIRSAFRGQVQLPPDVAIRLMNQIDTHGTTRADELPPSEVLTSREMEILSELGKGAGNQEIAQKFSISVKTVKTHVNNIFSKLGFTNRTQAAVYAVKNDLVK